MTVSITTGVRTRIKQELKARNISMTVLAFLAGYKFKEAVNEQFRTLRLQPQTVAALNKILIDI